MSGVNDDVSMTESQQKRLRDFHLSGESDSLAEALVKILRVPPNGNPQQKRVVVQFFINRIYKVDDVNAACVLDFYLKVNWIDEKYIGVSDDDFQEDEDKFKDGWWEPGVEVSNDIDLVKQTEKEEAFWIEHSKYGILAYTQRFIGSISAPMDLHDFPFDSQKIQIIFESFHWKEEDMVMFRLPTHALQFPPPPGEEWPTMSDAVVLSEWRIQGISVDERVNHYSFEDRDYSQIVVNVVLKRDFAYYLTKVFAMVGLIILMNFSVFIIDPSQLADRTSITVTLFLAAVAFNFVIASNLPKVGYNTRLDQYLLVAYVFIVMCLIESCVSYVIATFSDLENAADVAKKLDWTCLGSFPFFFIFYQTIFALVAWRVYKKEKFGVDPKGSKVSSKSKSKASSGASKFQKNGGDEIHEMTVNPVASK